MKEKLKENLSMLKNFLANIKSVELNPYSKGIDTVKLLDDIDRFTDDLIQIIEEDEKSTTDTPKESVEEIIADESEKAE